jgi:methyl-accepting chemotaxis protein
MPTGKKSRASPRKTVKRVRGNGFRLEEMRSQNRATIEAVEATRVALEAKIETVGRATGDRLTVLETAVRQNSADILKNSEDIRKNSEDISRNSEDIRRNSEDIRKNGEDIRVLTERVDALGPLDHRVSKLERHVFGEP